MKTVKNKIKLVVTIAIICLFVWFLVLGPMISFHNNEKALEKAARRYFELNSNKLPTGERVKTLSLSTLYQQSFIEKDLFIPYTKKTCSVEKSWVKVRRENNDYKYYVYLKCGVLSSTIDHKGPTIKLNGDEEMTIGLGEEFKDPGVKSVVDNSDGKLDVKDVTIKGKVDTSKIGTYEVTYTAFDNLSNKNVVTRKVEVVQKLNATVKKVLSDSKYYSGANPNNYVYFSNMLFRIVNIDGNNVRIVADKDIANVNFDGIDEWFKYYDEHISDSAKKFIVENKYCNMSLSGTSLDTTQCTGYTKKQKYGLLSIIDLNMANTGEGNYLIRDTITWTYNQWENNKETYAFRNFFAGMDSKYYPFENVHNLGIRPVITVKGDILIKDGNGTEENPYVLEDYVKTKRKVPINERIVGEYINYSGMLWRIQNIENDGTVRIISEQSLYNANNVLVEIDYDNNISTKNYIYNPTVKGNVGYKINNISSEYLDTSYFVKHEIEVPIYKGEPNYKKESKINKYQVKISSPNMYDMFSATTDNGLISSYWLLNSSSKATENPGMTIIGAIMYGDDSTGFAYGVRPVAYLNKNIVVTSGEGTKQVPFMISK